MDIYWNAGNEDLVFNVWPDAADIEPSTFGWLMSTSHTLCSAYAPTLPEGAIVPDSWKLAEIFQARDTWSKFQGGNSEQYGPDGMSIPVLPLVFVARDLLRPKTSPLGRVR